MGNKTSGRITFSDPSHLSFLPRVTRSARSWTGLLPSMHTRSAPTIRKSERLRVASLAKAPFLTLHDQGFVVLRRAHFIDAKMIDKVRASPLEPIFNGEGDAPADWRDRKRWHGRSDDWAVAMEVTLAGLLRKAGVLRTASGSEKIVNDVRRRPLCVASSSRIWRS